MGFTTIQCYVFIYNTFITNLQSRLQPFSQDSTFSPHLCFVFINDMVYSLISTSNGSLRIFLWQFFLFLGGFGKILPPKEKLFLKIYFCLKCLAGDLNLGLMSCQPTHHLLPTRRRLYVKFLSSDIFSIRNSVLVQSQYCNVSPPTHWQKLHT